MITPLRVRSGYSLLAGTAMPDRLVERARTLGHARLALTDVNNLYAAPAFWQLAGQKGLEPLLGAELSEGDRRCVALVAEQTGYENLCRIITRIHCRDAPSGNQESDTEGQGEKDPVSASVPSESRCRTRSAKDPDSLLADLRELSGGLHLVVQDAALASELVSSGLDSRRLWLGLDPSTQPQVQVRRLAESADQLHLPLLATGAALILEAGDYDLARLLAAIRLGTTYDALPEERLPHPRAVLRGPQDLARELADFPAAVRNNQRLADECAAFKLLPRKPVFPGFPCPEGMPAEAFLRKLCREGLPRRYREVPASAPPRLEKELGLIERLGFSEYFLVVWDIVQHARSRGTPVAGRGSGASSLAAYVLGLTNVCPLAYDIPFERFLHQGREDFPDLDIDFCWRIRDEVIEYVFRRWGSERVAMVCTHITFQERSCLRETAKAMGLSDGQISRLQEEGWNGQEADAGEDDAETRRDQSPRMSIRGLALPGSAPDGRGRIDGLARRLLGLPRNLSVHPGGVVIGRLPIDRYVPVQPAPKGVRITQYDKEGIEAIRLVKLDLLGNRNLSTVRYACDLVARRQGQAPSVEALPPADEATVALLRSADTIGCNQLESPAMRHLLKMMRPAGVADVMQALALIRPGAASIGMKEVFIRRHLGLEQVPPADGRVDSILGSTCGVMLYEDDVMLVAAALMGVPLEQADRFRKAVQKCRDDRQRLELTGQFLSRCRANGAEEACAKDLWVQMAKFNAYSFCRAHAASYALLAYAGAYLKAHHPLEFWTAALNNNQSMYHLRVYVEEAKRGGIRFLLPDANRSQEEFAVEGQAVRVGFNRVSGLGPASIAALLKARAAGAFDGLSDALCRAGLGRPEARALVLCGAFDYTGRRRPALMLELELAGRPCPRCQPALLSAGPTLPDATEDYSLRRKRRDQRGVLGFSVDEHVLSEFRPHLARMTDADSRQLAGRVGRRVRIAGLLEALRTTPARNGRDVTFLTLQDEYGLFEVTVFPGACRAVGPTFSRYGPYVVSGRVEDQYGAITVSADGIVLVPRAGLQGAPGADNRS